MKKVFILAIAFAMALTSCMSDYTREKAEERAELLLEMRYYKNQQYMIDDMWDSMRVMVSQDNYVKDYVIYYDTLGYYKHYIDTVTLSEYIEECANDYFNSRFLYDDIFSSRAKIREDIIDKNYHEADSIRDMVLAHDGSIKAFDRYVNKLLDSETFQTKNSWRFEHGFNRLTSTNELEQTIEENITHLDSVITNIKAGKKLEKRHLVRRNNTFEYEGEIDIDYLL